MAGSVLDRQASVHRVIGETRPQMAKAVLPKSENAEWRLLGEALDAARHTLRWTVDQLAGELKRDSKQVGRWLRGEERPQVDAVIRVAPLREPFLIAFAMRLGFRVRTTISLRRLA